MIWAAALAVGCSSRGQMEVLESRLRTQEDSIAQLKSQLSTSETQLQAAHRETLDLKTQLADKSGGTKAEQFSALGQVQGIALNKLLTGGLDRDGSPGDELLSTVIVPTDADGNLVKVPGTLDVTVLDLSKPEGEQRVGHWEFGPKDSDSLWHQGFLGSGYLVRVPWQATPQSPTLLVHARLKTVDGRQFDTSQSIRIVPPAASAQPAATVASASAQEPAAAAPPVKRAAPTAPAGDAWWNGAPGGHSEEGSPPPEPPTPTRGQNP